MEEDDNGEAECGRGERVSEGMHETPLLMLKPAVGHLFQLKKNPNLQRAAVFLRRRHRPSINHWKKDANALGSGEGAQPLVGGRTFGGEIAWGGG